MLLNYSETCVDMFMLNTIANTAECVLPLTLLRPKLRLCPEMQPNRLHFLCAPNEDLGFFII